MGGVRFTVKVLAGILIAVAFFPWGVSGQTVSTQIMVDQFGWRTTAKKVVVFADPQSGQNNGSTYAGPGAYFTVRKVSDNSRVYSNTTIPWNGGATHSQSQDKCWLGEFTPLTVPGDYYVQDANSKKSFNFKISDDVYTGVLKDAVRTYMYQRCGGTGVPVVNGGNWNHTPCHVAGGQDTAAQYLTNGVVRNRPRDVSGGWHDAGDYRKYMAMLVTTLWELMQAYELNPTKFPDNYNLPESANGAPDFLDEIRTELDWMLKMQKTNTGFVYSRVLSTNAYGNGTGNPPGDLETRFYTEPTSWATAIFAANAAKASRVFQSVNPGYADTLLRAATNAWSFLRATPGLWPADGNDGNCALWNPGCANNAPADRRYRIWASAELFRLTGRAEFNSYFTNNCRDYVNTRDSGFHPLEANRFDPSLALELNQAFITYVLTPGPRADLIVQIKNAIEGQCANTVSLTNQDPYRGYMYNGHYCWSSDSIKTRWANILLAGALLGVNPARTNLYRQMAEEYLSYFHGRNPLNWCYLSHMESDGADKSVWELYHGWFADGTALYDGRTSTYGMPPGFLSGGPDQFYSGTRIPPKNEPVMKSYYDWNSGTNTIASWECTEPAIYYQAGYILLLSQFATPPGITISNYQVTPSRTTNNKPRQVQFSAYIIPGAGYSITSATLYLAPLGGVKVVFSNKGANFYRYTYSLPFQFPQGEYIVPMKAYNNQGVNMDGFVILQVLTPPYLPVLTLYDGEAPPTSYLEAWRYGTVDFQDVTNSPKFGSTLGRLVLSNWGSGSAQLRDSSWGGLDASQADTLEAWVRGVNAASGVAQVRLFDRDSQYSAPMVIDVKPYLWKLSFPVSQITNKLMGANPGFEMSAIIGIEFLDNGGSTPSGTGIWFDNVILSTRVLLKNLAANPANADNATASNVRFLATARAALTNISSVTLDLTPLGGPKTAMSNISSMTGFRYTWSVPQGKVPGAYVLPVVAYDKLGNLTRGNIYFTVIGPVPKIMHIVYDGESSASDVNWEQWWGAITAADINDANVLKGAQSMKVTLVSNWSGGIQVSQPANWNGLDMTVADRFQFYYKSQVDLSLQLFSYDSINNVKYSKTIALPAAGGYRYIATNLSYMTNGLFNLKRFVGVQISSAAAGTGTAYFDEMFFTAMVEILNAKITPAIVTNTHKNVVVLSCKARSGNSYVSNVVLNLSTIGGASNAKMTNISGRTMWRYAFTIASNWNIGTYSVPFRAMDNKLYFGRGSAMIQIVGKMPYALTRVYDGDEAPVQPQDGQWYPATPPSSCQFIDVDAVATTPHSGSYCGFYQDTNASGNPSQFFHWTDSDYMGIDVSDSTKLEIWAKGSGGGETVNITPWFIGTNGAIAGNISPCALTKEWGQFQFPFASLTNGKNIGAGVRKFIGISIQYPNGYAKGSVVYLDDIAFITFVRITNQKAVTNFVNKDKDKVVVFTCQAFTKNSTITSCTLDLTSVGGTRVRMTNLAPGNSNYRFAFTIRSNFLLVPGARSLKVTARDDQNVSRSAYINMVIYSAYMQVLWDFETNSQYWVGDAGEGGFSNQVPVVYCPAGGSLTNWWGYASLKGQVPIVPPAHGGGCIGYSWNLNPKHSDTGNPGAWYQGGVLQSIGHANYGACSGGDEIYNGERGYTAWIYMEDIDTLEPDDPIYAMGFWMYGGAWAGCAWRGSYRYGVIPGRWNKVLFDWNNTFGSVGAQPGPPYIPSIGQTMVQMGWRMHGAYSASGTALLYFDYITTMDPLPPLAPGGLAVSDPATGGCLELNWSRVPQADIERYKIYISTNNNVANARIIISTKTNYYLDRAVWNDQKVYYWVSAVDYSENEGPKAGPVSGSATGAMPAVTYPYKGVVLLATNAGEFQAAACLTTLTNIKKTGANYVSIPITWCQANSNSVSIYSNPNGPGRITIPDADLRYIIQKITNMKMGVMIQLKLACEDGSLVYNILPSAPATWFASYQAFVMKYATIASQYNCGALSIGSRLYSVARANNNLNWANLITAVRARFKNKLTFGAAWGTRDVMHNYTNRELVGYKELTFWDDLDMIGIDAYWPVANTPDSLQSEMYAGWNYYMMTNDVGQFSQNRLQYEWYNSIKGWLDRKYPGKDVVFTEVGYPSLDFGARYPWSSGLLFMGASTNRMNANVNNQVQANGYEAMFRRFWDSTWMKGTFCNYFYAIQPGTPNGSPSVQLQKPSYNVVKDWYSLKPHHFSIAHDGGALKGSWEQIVITVHQVDHSLLPTWYGTVTLDIDKGTSAAVSWSNISGNGAFMDFGAGSSKAIYTFNVGDNGVATLAFKDNSMETVNLSTKSGYYVESPLEDQNMIVTGPLSHFEIVHNGYAVKDRWKTLTLRAIDVDGNVKVDFTGAVSLSVVATAGTLNWGIVGTNSTMVTNDSRARINFRLGDAGVIQVRVRDNTAETIDPEVKTVVGSFEDLDPNSLIVVGFDHFSVAHDGSGLLNFLEPFSLRAEDTAGVPVFGVTGNITISFTTNVHKARGAIGIQLVSGAGIFTNISPRVWVYTMEVSDAGQAQFTILDGTAETLDFRASDGITYDNDMPWQYLIFNTHKYHYVKKTPPINPVSPYVTPGTAATNIQQAQAMASPFDTVLILDSAVYSTLTIPVNAAGRQYMTYAGTETNRPTIRSNGGPAINVVDNYNSLYPGLVFKNLNIVAIGGRGSYYDQINGAPPSTNTYINCSFSNTVGDRALFTASGLVNVYYCEFKRPGLTTADAIESWPTPQQAAIGNTFVGYHNPIFDIGDNVLFYGNIVMGCTGDVMEQSICADAQYNTVYGGTANALAGVTYNNTFNNIVANNSLIGIGGGAGTHGYNHSYLNTPNFSTAAGTGDLTTDPGFVNAAAGDFRLTAASTAYNTAQPVGGVSGSRGAYNWSVKVAEPSIGTVTTYTLIWVPFRPLPPAGAFKLVFPAGTDCSGVTGVTSTVNGGFTWVGSGSNLLIIRDGSGSVVPPLSTRKIIVSGIVNPGFAKANVSILASTRAGDATMVEGDTLEFPRKSNCYNLISSDLVLLKGSPANGAGGLPLTTSVTCTFNTNLLVSTLHITNLYLMTSGWQKVPASYALNGTRTAVLTPLLPLEANEYYTVTVGLGLLNTIGGNLVKQTQWRFTTGTGPQTPHIYNTISPNGNLLEWQSANVVGTNIAGKVYELTRDDGGVDAVWGHTRQIWATWNTNNLYIAVRKPLLAGNEWWDYVAIDTVRNATGATNGPAGWHPLAFVNNRKPEYLLMLDHNNLGPVWDAWTNYRWTGAAWVASAIAATNHGQDAGQTVEVKIPWSVFGGGVPNRISLAAFVFTSPVFAGPLYDSCPETVNAGTNWVTIDPDNDGNDVPDYVRVLDHFSVSHDGVGNINQWEPFQLRAMDNMGGVYSNFTGLVTINLTVGTGPNVRFTNMSGAGTFTFLGNGRATYQWTAADLGLLTLRVVDSSVEAVNIRIAGTGSWPKYDDNFEGDLNFTSEARLRITKSGTPALASVGDILTYRLEITNLDGWYSYGVNVADVIPRGTTYVSGSMREGAKSSIYTNANILTDVAADDYGFYDGTKVIFCGPGSGVAPGTSGALAGGTVWVGYFRVRVRGTNSVTLPRTANITNLDGTFDGYCVNDGTFNSAGLISAGDNASPLKVTNLSQLSNNRDHIMSWDPDNLVYHGYADTATFQVGNQNIGGAGGEDTYRSYLTFGLAGVPANALITSATLFIRQTAAAGAGLENPIHVDHVDYQNVYGAAPVDAARYACSGGGRSVLQADMFTFNGLAAAGWVAIPATSQVQYADANLKGFTEGGVNRVFQVILRDNSEGMGTVNALATFSAQNDATPANRPYLRVYYELPGKEVRGYTGFDVSSVSNANITMATMFVFQSNVIGSAPAISSVIAESVDYGNSFDVGDYGALFLGSIGTFGVSAPGWVGVNATSAVSNAKAVKKLWLKNSSSNWLQVRFRPTLLATNNLQADQQLLGSAETVKKAFLRVYYPQTYVSGPWDIVTNTVVMGTNSAVATIQVQVGGTTLAAAKQITNITLKGAPSLAVPGATISFRIVCSNRTMTSGVNAMVLDKVVTNTMFVTNSATVGGGGWTLEYSTNSSPSFAYISANFTVVQPSSRKVKWIRWKRASWAGLAKDSFRYRVIVR